MRIFKKILSILFIISFIFSVSISIVFAISSSSINVDASDRYAMYYRSSYKLDMIDDITIQQSESAVVNGVSGVKNLLLPVHMILKVLPT